MVKIVEIVEQVDKPSNFQSRIIERSSFTEYAKEMEERKTSYDVLHHEPIKYSNLRIYNQCLFADVKYRRFPGAYIHRAYVLTFDKE
jgi:hypothetical protein